MNAKTPHPASISKVLGANGFTKASPRQTGYTVTSERGQHIDYNMNQSLGARFPLAKITLPEADIERAVKVLTAKGYHAEAHTLVARTVLGGAGRRYQAVLVLSQEELDHRAEREERAANAEAHAEKLVPATARVLCRVTYFPSHASAEKTGTREQVLHSAAKHLRKHDTEILTPDEADRERLYGYHPQPAADERITGIRINTDRGRATVLFIPIDTEEPTNMATTAPAPADTEETTTMEPTINTVLPHGAHVHIAATGATDEAYGVVDHDMGGAVVHVHIDGEPNRYPHDAKPIPRELVTRIITEEELTEGAIEALSERFEESDGESDGFEVETDGKTVFVYHVANGLRQRKAAAELLDYAAALEAAGYTGPNDGPIPTVESLSSGADTSRVEAIAPSV